MRIYIIIVDEPFFHPDFLTKIVDKLDKEVLGITILPDKSPRKSFFLYLKTNFSFWGFKGFCKLSFRFVLYKLLNFLQSIFKFRKFFSVKAVAKHYGIPVYETKKVNNKKHLDYIKEKNVDLIISACGQIFKRNLLNIPKVGIINRHSSLLPKYGGLWPVFWALLNNEEELGVSVHWMEEKIDSGDIIYQDKFRVDINDSLRTAYQKAFAISPEVVLKSVEKIKNKDLNDVIKFRADNSSYFSKPNHMDIKGFRMKRKMV